MAVLYRVYLRRANGKVDALSKKLIADKDGALEAFSGLVNQAEMNGQPLAAILATNDKKLAIHRFDAAPGSPEYWRDRLDQIVWPQRRAGRRVEIEEGRMHSILISDADWELARRLGKGKPSLGIQTALRMANAAIEQSAE